MLSFLMEMSACTEYLRCVFSFDMLALKVMDLTRLKGAARPVCYITCGVIFQALGRRSFANGWHNAWDSSTSRPPNKELHR